MSRRGNQIKGSATAAKLPHSPAHVSGNDFYITTSQLRDPSLTTMKAWLLDHGSELVRKHLTATPQDTVSSVDGQANQSPK